MTIKTLFPIKNPQTQTRQSTKTAQKLINQQQPNFQKHQSPPPPHPHPFIPIGPFAHHPIIIPPSMIKPSPTNLTLPLLQIQTMLILLRLRFTNCNNLHSDSTSKTGDEAFLTNQTRLDFANLVTPLAIFDAAFCGLRACLGEIVS